MRRRLGAILIALGVVCVLLAFCLDAAAPRPRTSIPADAQASAGIGFYGRSRTS